MHAASKVHTEVEGMDVAMHSRALQYAKDGSVLPFFCDNMDALQRCRPFLRYTLEKTCNDAHETQTSSCKVLVVPQIQVPER